MRVTKKIGVVISALAVLGTAGGIAASGAGAASTIVTASTSVSAHPDTTSPSGSGTACTSSANGAVWALDAYTSLMTAVSTGTNTWRVTLQDNGSFKGFADPNTCEALSSSGSLLGLYTVTVSSANTPSQANLHASYSGAVSTTQMVQDFFGDPSAVVNGGDYFFSYQNGNYVQTTGSLYGDVVATPVTLVKVPNVVGERATPALSKLRGAGFNAYTSPTRNPAYEYVVTGTSPAAGTLVPQGSTVVVYVTVA